MSSTGQTPYRRLDHVLAQFDHSGEQNVVSPTVPQTTVFHISSTGQTIGLSSTVATVTVMSSVGQIHEFDGSYSLPAS